ncbi:FG-GAP repeat-containing protein, partial [Candidatus Magnetobacterium bavaricum]
MITVKGPDGSDYKDVNGNMAQDKDGLDSNNIYIVDIPIYDDTSQKSGAKTDDVASIHVYVNGVEYAVTSPTGGSIKVGTSGDIQTVNLTIEGQPTPGGKHVRYDFDGDGHSDVLWRHAITGDVYIWLMKGTSITGGDFVVRNAGTDWDIKAAVDFNGDGKADILWQNSATGDVYMYLMDGTKVSSGGFVAMGIPGNWQIKAVADLDGDGKADVLWQETNTGDVAMWVMNGLSIVNGNYVVKG